MGKKAKRARKALRNALRKAEGKERKENGMCQIFYCHSSKPEVSLIEAESKKNDDGAGVMWFEKGKVLFEKGLSTEDATKLLMTRNYPCAIHLRNATHGGVSKELTHPFPISTVKQSLVSLKGRVDRAIMHNGTWHMWKERARDAALMHGKGSMPLAKWSDSMALAYVLGVAGTGILEVMDISDGRVLLFDAVEEAPTPYVWWWGKWHESKDKGYMHSCELLSTKACSTSTKGKPVYYEGVENGLYASVGQHLTASAGFTPVSVGGGYYTAEEIQIVLTDVMRFNYVKKWLPVVELGELCG